MNSLSLKSARGQKGFTVMELLVVVTIIGILMATATSNLKTLDNPLNDASLALTHFIKLTRARAVSQTKAITILPASSTRLKAQEGATCSSAMVDIADFDYDMPRSTYFVDTDWSVCFTSRGLANNNILFTIRNDDGGTNSIEIALGGGVRIQ